MLAESRVCTCARKMAHANYSGAHAFCDDCGRRVPVSKAYSCADCEVDLCNDCFSKVSRMHLCVLHDRMPHNQLVQSGPSEDETPTAPPVREGHGQTKPRSGHGLTPGSHVSTRQTSPTPPALRVPSVSHVLAVQQRGKDIGEGALLDLVPHFLFCFFAGDQAGAGAVVGNTESSMQLSYHRRSIAGQER
jgi:hypothetical protein